MNNTLRNTSILLLVIANAGCDQISKHAARQNISYEETIEVIGKHLVFTKIENSGAFLSTGDSLAGSVKFIFLSLLPLIALCYGIYYLITNTQLPRLLVLGICFVIGGGLGNLYDRLIYGSVTDFVHIDFFVFKTGIFNLADVSIMVGMILILINLYVKPEDNTLIKE
ncbi:signal peptidase II [Pedobacter hartonius]|uniref:Lipoprotein signal peptidase n=1 Tax=Pedobacter hartonius TaxID=425514 RepID=A0A1H4BG10_9SPHI|nr:signal peptidase II [Pedobacter hartonius]SEA47099.1 signal peptidase II [Pedobacter hartonius]